MSSLFGSAASSGQSQPTRTNSLFGNLSASPAQSQVPGGTNSLFGNLGTSQPQNQSASTSLFGSASTSQSQAPSGGSLFGNLNANSSQSQQKPSLFGTAAEQPKPTSSLFGQAQSQQPSGTSAGGLFGGSAAPNSQAAPGSTMFGTIAQTQAQQSQPLGGQGPNQQADGNQPANAAQAQPGYFGSLLEKGRKRHREVDGGSSLLELPNLQLNLNDIAKRARELGRTSTAAQGGNASVDSNAHYLLAASGVNPGRTRRDLDNFAAQQTLGNEVQSQPTFDPDTHAYLDQLQQAATTKMINDGLERAHRKFDEYIEERVDINWELQRKRIYEHFGLTPRGADNDTIEGQEGKGAFGRSSRRSRLGKSARSGQSTLNRSIFGQSSIQKSVIGNPGPASDNGALFADVAEKPGGSVPSQDDRSMREKQRKYAEKVQNLNQRRLELARTRARQSDQSYPILKEFQSVENQPGGDTPKQLLEAYQALIEIIGEPTARERQFADDYLDETPNSSKNLRMRRRIIDGSRRSLEKAFFDQLVSTVAKNPREANLGGVPTAINQIRAYIRIRIARKDLVPDGQDLFFSNGDYCWPLLFFCLRCGLVKEAADYVTENAVHFRAFDKNIITYLTNYASNSDRRLDRKLQPLCNNVYTSLSKADAIDPYRVACYKIIGRCDLPKRNLEKISQGVEDWIWLQFCLAREVNRAEESAGDVFSLDDVQETIQEIGQRHFAKGAEGTGGYGTYFLLQILGGMFEQAVSYLYSYSYMTAAHFAIALDYYGLLRVSDFSVSETELCEELPT